MIRPPTAAATCTTSASIDASLEEGCARTHDATRSASTIATAGAASAMRRPREVNRRMPSAFTSSPEERHPEEQSHDDAHGRTDSKLEGDHVVKRGSRKDHSGAGRRHDADQCAQHPCWEVGAEQLERG